MIEDSYAFTGVEYCNKLFEIERQIAEFDVLEREKIRKEKSLTVLEEFYEWVNKTNDEKMFMSKKLSKAITYAINQKEKLSEFINDGRIPLSNSLIERNIRPFAILRKNCLFSDSVKGAKASAVMYSLVQTAKINNLNISGYIKYLLENLSQEENAKDEKVLEKYLPWSEELPAEIRGSEAETELEENLSEKEEGLKNLIVK